MNRRESGSAGDTTAATTRPTFTIKGRFHGDKCLPSLNDYISEIGRDPRAGGRMKRMCIFYISNAIRRDLKRYKAGKAVILHYTLGEPARGKKRDYGNIFGLADKFIEDALRDCGVIKDDSPRYVKNFTHEFVYTDGEPFIRVEIEEIPD